MTDEGEFDHPAPPGIQQEFTVASPELCEDCGGWEGVVVQLNRERTHGRLFCTTPHMPTSGKATERAAAIADALEAARTGHSFPATVGMVQ